MLLHGLLACAHGPAAFAPGDTSNDTARDTSGDTSGDGPCGAFAGVRGVGTRWTYAPNDAYVATYGYDGTFGIEVAAIDEGNVTLAVAGSYTGDGGGFSWTRTDTWRCDDAGAWLTHTTSTSRSEPGGSELEGSRAFDPGWLIRPASLDEGATWTDSFALTSAYNGGEPVTEPVTCTSTVDDRAVREVDAGAVEALHVGVQCDGIGADGVWLHEGMGMIENDDEALVAYAP